MKTLIIGAGLAGITSSYYLSKLGHEVTVVDGEEGPAQATSFSNGGQISVSQPFPWSKPDLPKRLLGWIGRKDAPMVFRLQSDPYMWRWLLRFLANGRSRPYYANAAKILRLALLSKDELVAINNETGIEYNRRQNGILKLFNRNAEADAFKACEWLGQNGVDQKILDRAGCIDLEPALAHSSAPFVGGSFSAIDESGDAFDFTRNLATIMASRGAAFEYGSAVTGFETTGDIINRVRINGSSQTFDNIVITAGISSRFLGRFAGIDLPVYPVKGYSVTLPIIADDLAPQLSLTDDANHIVISRLGDQLRAAGTAEIGGYDDSISMARTDLIVSTLQSLFPGALDFTAIERWAGLRPMTPDCVPLIGRTKYKNLYLNTGHGALGWTLAAGSARLLCEIITGTETSLDSTDYKADRF